MSRLISRREALRVFGSAGAGAAFGGAALAAQEGGLRIAGRSVEIAVSSVSAHTVRISLAPLEIGRTQPIRSDGSLIEQGVAPAAKRFISLTSGNSVRFGDLLVALEPDPLTIRVEAGGRLVQQLRVDGHTGSVA